MWLTDGIFHNGVNYSVVPLLDDAVTTTDTIDAAHTFIDDSGSGDFVTVMVDRGSSIRQRNGSFPNASSSSVEPGGYSATVEPDFVQFDDLMLIFQFGSTPLQKDIDDSEATLFATLGGAPPTARTATRLENHIIAGGAGAPNRVRTCELGNPSSWPTSGTQQAAGAQAISEDLPRELGKITAARSNDEIAVVFQEYGMTRFQYVGGRSVYSVKTYESSLGSLDIRGTMQHNGLFYGLSSSGPVITNGDSVVEPGKNLYTDSLSKSPVPFTDYPFPIWPLSQDIEGVAWWQRHNCIAWCISDTSLLIYNIDSGITTFTDNFSTVGNIQGFFGTPAGLTAVDRFEPVAFIGTGAHSLASPTDDTNRTVELQTAFIEPFPNRRAKVSGVHLIGGNIHSEYRVEVVAVDDYKNVDLQSDGVLFQEPTRDLFHRRKVEGRFFSVRITGPLNTTAEISGIRLELEDASER
jgi:hypothetical protein